MEFILKAHSIWAFIALGLILIAAVNSLWGMSSGKTFTLRDRKIAMYGLIAAHIQLVFGFLLLFMGPHLKTAMDLGMGAAMKNSGLRLLIIEHPLINIIAIILITIAWSRHKKATTDKMKFSRIGWLYLVGLLLLLSRVPWATWFN